MDQFEHDLLHLLANFQQAIDDHVKKITDFINDKYVGKKEEKKDDG